MIRPARVLRVTWCRCGGLPPFRLFGMTRHVVPRCFPVSGCFRDFQFWKSRASQDYGGVMSAEYCTHSYLCEDVGCFTWRGIKSRRKRYGIGYVPLRSETETGCRKNGLLHLRYSTVRNFIYCICYGTVYGPYHTTDSNSRWAMQHTYPIVHIVLH